MSTFGAAAAARFATGVGEPEDQLRGPFEVLLAELARLAGGLGVVLTGEVRLAAERVRPDYAVHVGGALVGFVEVKAPGKGADPTRFRDRHDREQWERLRSLPNVLYTDGQSFGLYRNGERVGDVVELVGRVETAGRALAVADQKLLVLAEDFLRWAPTPPRRAKDLALDAARLCRLLRTEVLELLRTDAGLRALAADWRELLFPQASDEEFADGYAQTVTFALLLARVEEVDFADGDLRRIAGRLGQRHTLIGTALDVLTNPAVLDRLAASVNTLVRVLSVVDWAVVGRGDPAKWLLFYEDFLDEYDPALRRRTGSYYTPTEVVDAMVRLVDGLLRERFGRHYGFAAPDVTVVDPACGTGTFLFRIVDRIAATVAEEEGPGAVPAKLRQAADRLVGFELQAGPFSVAELRLAGDYRSRNAPLPPGALRLYVANTLDDPFVAEHHLAAVYEPIAQSRHRANTVKKDEPVLVVIGNPPYKERSRGEGGWIEHGNPGASQAAPLAAFVPPAAWRLGAHVKHLYNPYVYFWRWATWKVFEHHPDADRGVVAYITVAGFLHGPGFAAMRAYLRRMADEVWVIDLSPEGHQPEVNTRVFAGVQQPVCIAIAVRDGATGPDAPARVQHRSVRGLRQDKFDQLAAIELGGAGWADCPTDWTAPFLPAAGASWAEHPGLDDLLAWSGSGMMPGRTWVCDPSPGVLRARWDRFVAAPLAEKPALLVEHRTDRRVDTRLSDGLPGFPTPPGPLAAETGPCPAPERIGYRSFDRQWVIPDKRLINRPNPSLWQARSAEQVYLTALMQHSPSSGPAATFAALVPDLHHYRGSFGGRAYPLWLDAEATRPNAVPGLLDYIVARYGRPVSGPDLFAYLAAVVAHPGYTARFAGDLATPGLRVPLTADADLFAEAVALGCEVVWLHTYGERFVDPAAGRPARPPRLPPGERPLVLEPIPVDPAGMPEAISYDPATRRLTVGAGVVGPVPAAVWDYEVSGVRVVKKWFGYRKANPEGRRSSPLEDLNATTWDAAWTTELLELLNVLALLVAREATQVALLERIATGPLVTVADLTAAGVLPVAFDRRPTPTAAERSRRGDAPSLLDPAE